MNQSKSVRIALICCAFLTTCGFPSISGRSAASSGYSLQNATEVVPASNENGQNDPRSLTSKTGILLPEGTRITLQLYEDVSSRDQTRGRVLQWSVYKNVIPPGESAVVVLAGAFASGKVTFGRRAGVFGRPGHIAVNAASVQAVDGQDIPVYCKPIDVEGKSRRALAWCLGIGLSIVGLVLFSTLSNGGGIFLLAVLPMFLGVFISGKDVTLLAKSTLIEVTVQRDMMITP